MIDDYSKALVLRTVTKVSDSAGGFTETTADSAIYGYIAELSGREVERAKALSVEASSALFTSTSLNLTDRVLDGSIEYEVVWAFTNFHTYYLLRRVKT